MIKLPKKITPDSIKEAVVEVKYISTFPFELLPGIFFKAFDDSYMYADRPVRPTFGNPQRNLNAAQEISIQVGKPSILYNDKITLQLLPQSFVFNCLTQYIGWDDYQPQLEKALRSLLSTNAITEITRVGMRYITEYSKKDLKDCTRFKFEFGLPQIQSETVAFKSEFLYKNFKVILNLGNKVPVLMRDPKNNSIEQSMNSIIDIDVIKENLAIKEIDGLLKTIEETHYLEKEIYFGLITEEFLQTLNPQY